MTRPGGRRGRSHRAATPVAASNLRRRAETACAPTGTAHERSHRLPGEELRQRFPGLVVAQRERGGQVLDQRLAHLADNERRDHRVSRPVIADGPTSLRDLPAALITFIVTLKPIRHWAQHLPTLIADNGDWAAKAPPKPGPTSKQSALSGKIGPSKGMRPSRFERSTRIHRYVGPRSRAHFQRYQVRFGPSAQSRRSS
mgnify:CR=1 FL=1